MNQDSELIHVLATYWPRDEQNEPVWLDVHALNRLIRTDKFPDLKNVVELSIGAQFDENEHLFGTVTRLLQRLAQDSPRVSQRGESTQRQFRCR